MSGFAEQHRAVLTADAIRTLWSKTYNSEGKPDWKHIFPLYHDDLVFRDSIQTIKGKPRFIKMCDRLTRRCDRLTMELGPIASWEHGYYFSWDMTMVFRKSPNTPIHGCTRLTIEHGLIIEQRDFYDLWGDIFDGIPGFRRIYRKFMSRFFG